MNKSTLGIASAAVLVTGIALASLSVAQEHKRGDHASGHRGDRAEMMFARFDTDNDGRITLEEFEANQKDRFASADENGDGGISRDEMIAVIRATANERAAERAEKMADRMFSHLDADSDGLISTEEIPSDRAATMFARLDANGDGSIVLAEIGEIRRGHGGGFGKHNSE